MKIQDIMTRQVHTCFPDDTANLAAQKMWENDFGCVPVIDAKKKIAGMITDRDLCMAAYTQDLPLSKIRIASAMSHKVHTCHPEDNLQLVEQIMREKKVRRLPVVDNDQILVGLISLNDLALEAAREKDLKQQEISEREIAAALGAISQHRLPQATVS